MEYLKFIPEGWENANEAFSKNDLERAMNDKCILQGVVENCDSNYNLHVNFGDNIKGVIPRNELEAINVDEFGFCNPNICKNKVNNFVLDFTTPNVYNRCIVYSKQIL